MGLLDSIESILTKTDATNKAIDELNKSFETSEIKKEKQHELTFEEKVVILKTEVNNFLSKYKDGDQLSLDDKDKALKLAERAEKLKAETNEPNDLGDLNYNLTKMVFEGVKKGSKELKLDNDFEM